MTEYSPLETFETDSTHMSFQPSLSTQSSRPLLKSHASRSTSWSTSTLEAGAPSSGSIPPDSKESAKWYRDPSYFNPFRAGSIRRKEPEDRKKSIAVERNRRRRWFNWLAWLFASNIALWSGMMFAIYYADYMKVQKKAYVTGLACISVSSFACSFLLLVGIVKDCLAHFRLPSRLWKQSINYANVLNLLNGGICLVLVAVYLYAYAIPQYNRPVWSAAVDTSGAMPVPSFTLAANSASASIKIQSCGKYTAPGDNFEHGCDEGVISMIAPRDPHYSGELIFFNASQLPSKTIAPFSEYYTISFSITYNMQGDQQAAVVECVQMSFNDPRLDPQNYFSYLDVPLLDYNIVPLGVEGIKDAYGLLTLPSQSAMQTKKLLSDSDNFLNLYSPTVIPVNTANACRTGNESTIMQCNSEFRFLFNSYVINTMESIPGIQKGEIWMNAGAIVGAVQFFVWFLTIFNS